MRRNKYNAIKTNLDGITFDSRREAVRYAELKLLQRAGDISKLQCQPSFVLEANGVAICKYVADFAYISTSTGKTVVEDVKSKATKTPVYRLKKKLAEAQKPPIDIIEIF